MELACESAQWDTQKKAIKSSWKRYRARRLSNLARRKTVHSVNNLFGTGDFLLSLCIFFISRKKEK